MPVPGFGGESPVDLTKRSFKTFIKDDMGTYAAALSYQALFAIFPFLLFLISFLGFLHMPQFFDWLLEQAQAAFPPDAFARFEEVITQIRNQPQGGLLSFGIIAAIWASSGGMRALMNALNVAYGVEETRPMWKKYLLSILYTVAIAILLIAGVALMLLGPDAMTWLADQIGLGSLFVTLWTWLRFPVLIILLTIVAALLYYVAPNVEQPFKLITPGAIVAVVLWIVASIGFSIYVSNFSNYNATYGSLGGVIVLLTYFFISSSVLLLGAEMNAEIHKDKLGTPVPEDQTGTDQETGNQHADRAGSDQRTGRDQLLLGRRASS